jgi:uncharacterized protein involved in tellurium resistance
VIGNPAGAPRRPDLTFLRRRTRPKPPPPPTPPPAQAKPSTPPISFTRPDRKPAAPQPAESQHAQPRRAPAQPTPAAPTPAISFARPDRPSSLLDLSDAPAPPPASATAPGPAAAPKLRVHRDGRIRAGTQQLLSVKQPTVTLTRVQSGIGQLKIEAVCSPEVGDLRLGTAYQLRSGPSSTVQYTGGNRYAPSSRRPVIVAGRDDYEHVRLDLRQTPDLERLAVYAYSESRTELTWGGTLVVETFGGARIELPLESLFAGRVAVLLSIYNLDGELVIRAEMETISGDVREAARAYGYDHITWRDDRSPVD